MAKRYTNPRCWSLLLLKIINPNEANSVVGVIYKHPCINGDTFNNDYLKPLLSKLSTQNNKNIYISL